MSSATGTSGSLVRPLQRVFLSGIPRLGAVVAGSFPRRRSRPTARCYFGMRTFPLEESKKSFHSWSSDGPGRDPKLRVVVRSSMSGVPEKPLGLYDPALDKDSCGVGFVAELSDDSNRNTVTDGLKMLVRMTQRSVWVRNQHRRWGWDFGCSST